MRQSNANWLIAGILTAGVLAAGASWWFRFEATHRSARFWGPVASQLIRDAPLVELLALQHAPRDESDDSDGANTEPTGDSTAGEVLTFGSERWRITDSRDISAAPGLTHLRNALLEDRSFSWPARSASAETQWARGLRFRNGPEPSLHVLFSPDYQWIIAVGTGRSDPLAVSCEPIANGLREVFSEWSPKQTDGR